VSRFEVERASFALQWDLRSACVNGRCFSLNLAESSIKQQLMPGRASALTALTKATAWPQYLTTENTAPLRTMARTLLALQANYAWFAAIRWAPSPYPVAGEAANFAGNRRVYDSTTKAYVDLVRSEFLSLAPTVPVGTVLDRSSDLLWVPALGGWQVANAARPAAGVTKNCDRWFTNTNSWAANECTWPWTAVDRVTEGVAAENGRIGFNQIGGWQQPTTAVVTALWTRSATFGGGLSAGQTLASFLGTVVGPTATAGNAVWRIAATWPLIWGSVTINRTICQELRNPLTAGGAA
jgi:hypothetical protein